MSTFVESLKRLYMAQRIEIIKLKEFVESNKITSAQYTEITGDSYTA